MMPSLFCTKIGLPDMNVWSIISGLRHFGHHSRKTINSQLLIKKHSGYYTYTRTGAVLNCTLLRRLRVCTWTTQANALYSKYNAQLINSVRHMSYGISEFETAREGIISEALTEIVEKVCPLDVMYKFVTESDVKQYVDLLLSYDWDINLIKLTLINTPCVLKQPVADLKKFTAALLINGFNNAETAELIQTLIPENISADMVLEKVARLREIGFADESVYRVIERCPRLVVTPTKQIQQRIEELRKYFKSGDVLVLLQNSPNVLYDDLSEIMEKFNYVFANMGITQPQMMFSQVFSRSMEHIRIRHIFLERAGIYIKPKHDEKRKKGVPILSEIVNPTDTEFVDNLPGISLLDYKTFCAMMEIEVKKDSDYFSDSDSEDSSDKEEGN